MGGAASQQRWDCLLSELRKKVTKRKRQRSREQHKKPPFVLADCDVVEVITYEEYWIRERLMRKLSGVRWPLLAMRRKR